MWTRTPAQAPANVPQAIVDFIGLCKDPQWLKSLVQAAESISEANKLTEEEAENLSDAKALIEKAQGLGKEYKDREVAVSLREDAVRDRELKVSAREKQCDERDSAIAGKEKENSDRAAVLQGKHKDACDRAKELDTRYEKYAAWEAKIRSRENEVSRREQAFEKIKAVVNG